MNLGFLLSRPVLKADSLGAVRPEFDLYPLRAQLDRYLVRHIDVLEAFISHNTDRANGGAFDGTPRAPEGLQALRTATSQSSNRRVGEKLGGYLDL